MENAGLFQPTNEKFILLVFHKNERRRSSLVIEKVDHDLFHLNFDGFNFKFGVQNVLHYIHAIQHCIIEDYHTYSQVIDVLCPIFPCTKINIFRNKFLIKQLFCIWNAHLIKNNHIELIINEGNNE